MKFMIFGFVGLVGTVGCGGSSSNNLEQKWEAMPEAQRETVCVDYNDLVEVGMDQDSIVNLLVKTQGVNEDDAVEAVLIMTENC